MTEFFKAYHRQELEWAGRKLTIETGKVARQASGAVTVTYGGTTVLCTVVAKRTADANMGFFPLSVHYFERAFAVGRIPGGFIKREGKPSDKEVLTSRLIDRPIRPLFPEEFLNEVQIICSVLSHDLESDSEIAAMIGASAALAVSGIPFHGPIAAARVGYVEGQFVLNPSPTVQAQSQLDLIVAGTASGVLMVESEAKELPEEIMLDAVDFGHKSFQPILTAINQLAAMASKAKWGEPAPDLEKEAFYTSLRQHFEDQLRQAYAQTQKQERHAQIEVVKQAAFASLCKELEVMPKSFTAAFKKLEGEILRFNILDEGRRVDGRNLTTVRPIECEVGFLPRTHGSALFTRGETQALVVTTLGTAQDEQIMDAIEGEYRERFLLHYNFPPFSVGEVGRIGIPSRREIGHGKLAWRALNPLLPEKKSFPYTIRAVSEITESNGSSSMASVCGASLSMMDAGVPLKRPVAGIAMGLIKEDDRYAVLSDILGDEDHLGDMDFKVAGTDAGITALQMDIKITSITHEIMTVALQQAREGRLHILGEMKKALHISRDTVSTHAPRMTSLQVAREKIRELIGPGGKTIREICDTTKARIDIEDDGTVNISAYDDAGMEAALRAVQAIAVEPEVGAIYNGTVVKVMDFGAFVNFLGSRDGLVHVSEIANERIERVSDVLKVGDKIRVKVVGFDDRGKVKLSMKALIGTENNEEASDA